MVCETVENGCKSFGNNIAVSQNPAAGLDVILLFTFKWKRNTENFSSIKPYSWIVTLIEFWKEIFDT